MKKKFFAILFASVMTISLVACSGNDVATSKEEVVVEESEQNLEEEVVEAEEPEIIEEVVEEPKDTRMEDGVAKVYKVVDAYKDILEHDHELDLSLQNDVEKMLADTFYLEGYNFQNGKDFFYGYGIYSTLMNYYYQYVNNDSGYFSIADWISQQPDEDTVIKMYIDGEPESTNDMMMFEAICVAKFLLECESVEGKELIETTEYNVSGVQSAYTITLNCDGNEDLVAVFDVDNNLLNIRTTDEWEYTYTFE